MTERLRLRPFHELLPLGQDAPMLEVTGSIRDDAFVVVVFGERVPLTTVAVHRDERGPFAVVDECDRAFSRGYRLQLSMEPDEELPAGARLTVYFEGAARSNAESVLRSQGRTPDSVILLVPNERDFSVYFDSDGVVNGTGSLGETERQVRPSN